MRQSINNMINPEDNSENFDFAQFLRGRIKERGFDLKKLSGISGITVKHLESLASGNFHNLPSTPYFRGYLLRLGQVLDFDADAWWTKLKSAESVKNSGAGDEPCRNRFEKIKNAKFVWIAVVIAVVVLFFAFELPRIIGKPTIKVTNPSGNPTTVKTGQIDISGILDGASELYINGEPVGLTKDGSWNKTVLLEAGANSFEIKAQKFLGGETKIIEQIIYEPEAAATSTSTINPNL